MSDFYVGYLPPPPKLRHFLWRVALALIVMGATVAGALLLTQQPFAAATFEYGHEQEFVGTVHTQPYPMLEVTHSGADAGARTLPDGSRTLLVATGKRGADALTVGWDGRFAKVRGTLIHRDGKTMIEVSAPLVAADATPPPSAAAAEILVGPVTLTGEIVDSKCYLGVMNPGQGKVHRDCAARCISGGVPPALLTSGIGGQNGYAGQTEVALLTDVNGHAPKGSERLQLLRYAGEPVAVSGTLWRTGGMFTLRADLAHLQPIPSGLGGR